MCTWWAHAEMRMGGLSFSGEDLLDCIIRLESIGVRIGVAHLCHVRAVSAHLGRFRNSALFAVRVRGVANPKALAKHTAVTKQMTSQTCGGGVYVVIIRITCSACAWVHCHGATNLLIS